MSTDPDHYSHGSTLYYHSCAVFHTCTNPTSWHSSGSISPALSLSMHPCQLSFLNTICSCHLFTFPTLSPTLLLGDPLGQTNWCPRRSLLDSHLQACLECLCCCVCKSHAPLIETPVLTVLQWTEKCVASTAKFCHLLGMFTLCKSLKHPSETSVTSS